MAQLEEWRSVWGSADITTKNQLLRAAGLRVEVGQLPGARPRDPDRILTITAANPAFQLALAAALAKPGSEVADRLANSPCSQQMCEIRLQLGPEAAAALEPITPLTGASVGLPRPDVPHHLRASYAEPEGGPWLTVAEFADRVGLTGGAIRSEIHRGAITSVLARPRERRWRLIPVSELDRRLAERGRRVRPAGHLNVPEFAARTGLSEANAYALVRKGRIAAFRYPGSGSRSLWIAESEIETDERLSGRRRPASPRPPAPPVQPFAAAVIEAERQAA
jgi:hypothetical protein